MGEANSTANHEDEGQPNKDVWSRSGPTYRVRAVVLLLVNVLLFGGVGSFAYWLRSGEQFAPTMDGYWDELRLTFHFTGDMEITLASFLASPMSVRDVPMLIPILGLLLAALVAIPILVSILYRFPASLPFILVVGFLAVMPWLAITLLASCILASVKPFRRPWRFASALLGLLPIVLYLFLASRGSDSYVGELGNPMDKIKFVAPWVIAMVAATLLAGVVLLIARVVDYRPGALAPLLAVMFGLPVALFEFHVGRDELYYRLLEQELRLFKDVSAAEVLERRAEESWLEQPEPRMKFAEWKALVELIWRLEVLPDDETIEWTSELTEYQQRLARHCDWFIKYFPTSRYACNALYIKGQTLSTRVDVSEFQRTKWIRYYGDFPSRASWSTWRMIVENRPRSPLSAVALLRLAQLDARACLMKQALDQLNTLVARFDKPAPAAVESSPPGGALARLFKRPPPEAGLNLGLERTLLEAHRLRDLLAANEDPIYGYEPLCGSSDPSRTVQFGLLRLVPREDRYIENLRRLKDQYPRCQIEDNIDLEIAKTTPPGTRRTELLVSFLDRYGLRDVDALPEALFRLGTSYLENGQRPRADEQFERLLREYPQSIWARQARRYAAAPVGADGGAR